MCKSLGRVTSGRSGTGRRGTALPAVLWHRSACTAQHPGEAQRKDWTRVARGTGRKQGLEIRKGSAEAAVQRPYLLVPPVRSHETRKMSQLQSEHLPGPARHAARLRRVAQPQPAHSLLLADWLSRLVGGALFPASYWPINTSFPIG